MKKLLVICIAISLCAAAVAFDCSASMQTITADIVGYDLSTVNGVVAYKAGDTDRTLSAADYSWGNAYILSFDKDGKLYEAGKGILPSQNDYYGAQTVVTIPAGGFMLAFPNSSTLMKAFNACFDGVMLYNATCSMTYDMTASIDEKTNKVTVNVGDPIPETEDTVKFLFVGNSSTYFNGNPIKFEALCRAAGLDVKVTYCTFGSAYLSEFANENHERGKALRHALKNDKYDYVVLQDAAGATYDSSKASIQTILPLIEENGAEALLYMRYSTSISGAQKYKTNYGKLSEEFGIKTCTSALAFAYCMENYPDINLIAEDGGHHSKEGSYLAACSWLYAYMGVDPRGNTYTAGMSADVVAALQESAYEAAVNYFDYGGGLTKTIDGVKYTDVAQGASYVPDGKVYTGNWTDTKDDGTPIGKLTDGIVVTEGSDTSVGCYTGTAQSITVNLGSLKSIKQVETDLFGQSSWGIPDPSGATVDVFVSADGNKFDRIGTAEMSEEEVNGGWKRRLFTVTLDSTVNAQYVKLEYELAGNYLWTSEIAVYGGDTANEDESEVAESEAADESKDDGQSIGADQSTDNNESVIGGSEPAVQNLTWLWILIAAVVVIAAAVVIVLLLKKK